MSFFSRLTDIVTCNLSELLAQATDPPAALEEIIDEIKTGVEAAQRSVKTATISEERIRTEIDELANQLKYWMDIARQEVKNGDEGKARLALMRKGEVEDLIAGIKQQHAAAEITLKHLTTTLHALEARLSDAIRRRASVCAANDPATVDARSTPAGTIGAAETSIPEGREHQIEAELAALKRELDA